MPATPGKRALVRVTGVATAFVTEACTTLVANLTYQVTNIAKQVWDRSVAILVYKDAVLQSAALYTVNRLNGSITFLADIGGGHVITISGSYLPLAAVVEGKTFSWEITRQNLDVSAFQAVWITRIEGLKDGKCSVGKWKTVDETMSAYVLAGVPVVIDLDQDTSQAAGFGMRMWGMPTKDAVNAVHTGTVEEMVEFIATPDVDNRIASLA